MLRDTLHGLWFTGALLLLVAASACGGNVVVDGSSPGHGGAGAGGASSSASTASGASGAGGSCPAGTCVPPGGGGCQAPTGQLGNACCSCAADGTCADPCK